MHLRRHRLLCQPLEGLDQRMSKAMRAVAAFQNGFAFYLIQKQPDLGGGHLLMVQPAHELRNRPLEVDVVLPQRVVGIDEESLGGDWHRLCMINGETGDRRHRRHRASSPSSVVGPPISAIAAMMWDYGDLEISRCPDVPMPRSPDRRHLCPFRR